MDHHFDIEDAKKYGVHEAIFLQNIRFWVKYNQANRMNYVEGRYWTFNSAKSFSELLPYFTTKQIQTIAKNLISSGILLTGCYNKNSYDRTTWYTINEEWTKGNPPSEYDIAKREEKKISDCLRIGPSLANLVNSISPNGKIENTDRENQFPQTGQPIPDNKLNIKNSYIKEERESNTDSPNPTPSQVLQCYNETVQGSELPQAKESLLTRARREVCVSLSRKHLKTIEHWRQYFTVAANCDFLNGANDRGWRASLDFLLKESNFVKVMEGNYRNKKKMPISKNEALARALGMIKD